MTHLLKHDRWILDFAAALFFVVGMTVGSQILGDSWDGGRTPWNITFRLSGIALASYTATFLVGMAVRKRASFVRSWVWMSIVGALVFTIVFTIIAIPTWLEAYRRFNSNSGVTQSEYLLGHLPGSLAICVIFAIFGATMLLVVRLIVGLIEERRTIL